MSTTIHLFSDSLSSLLSIAKRHSSSNPNIIEAIYNILSYANLSVLFHWIPSHVGIAPNEQVDQLAQQATSHAVVDIQLPFELYEMTQLATSFIDDCIQEWWSTQSSLFSRCNPTWREISIFPTKSRRHEVQMARLRLGACLLNHYLYRIGRHQTGLCQSCQVAETLEHFLLHCSGPVSSVVQSWCSDNNKPLTLEFVLSSQQLLNTIISVNSRWL
jgi:hypothetical protein